METRTCLIVDDEQSSVDTLMHCLNKIGLFNIRSANTIKEANLILKSEKIDLIFSDIQLGEESGLDFVKSHTKLPPVIITSAHPEFAINTYDVDSIVDFLQKPYLLSRLQKAINKALGNIYSSSFFIEKDFAFLKVSRKAVKFDYNNIEYIEAYGVYSKIYNKGQFQLVNEPISILDNSLPTQLFRRVHKSYIINLKKITGYDHKFFIINDAHVPIGASYKESLQALFKIFSSDL